MARGASKMAAHSTAEPRGYSRNGTVMDRPDNVDEQVYVHVHEDAARLRRALRTLRRPPARFGPPKASQPLTTPTLN